MKQNDTPILSEEQLLALGKHFLPRSQQSTGADCIDPGLLIAYALYDEIGEDDKNLVETHAKKCSRCLEIILDTRAADARAQRQAEEKEADNWVDLLKKIPAFLVLPEHEDKVTVTIPGSVSSMTVDIADSPFPAGLAETLIASEPSVESLPLMQDSGWQTVTFARVATLANDTVASLHFLELAIITSIFEQGVLNIVATITTPSPVPFNNWVCGWMTPDGKITTARESNVTESTITAVFEFPENTTKPEGNLRVLLFSNKK